MREEEVTRIVVVLTSLGFPQPMTTKKLPSKPHRAQGEAGIIGATIFGSDNPVTSKLLRFLT